MSTLDSILAQLNDEAVTMKTASDNSPAPVTHGDAALEAVRAATKIASAQAPQHYSGDAVAALHKIAAETAAMEDVMMAKQAQDYGALVCDGFMQRLAQYDGAFGAEKTASAGVSQADLEKVAAAYYQQGAIDFEKTAAAQYEAGYNETMAQVHKIASDLHIAGQSNARQVVAALGGQKTAASMPSREAVMAALKSPTAIGGAAGAGLGALGADGPTKVAATRAEALMLQDPDAMARFLGHALENSVDHHWTNLRPDISRLLDRAGAPKLPAPERLRAARAAQRVLAPTVEQPGNARLASKLLSNKRREAAETAAAAASMAGGGYW